MSECIRCGQCCISVGRTFWRKRKGDFEKYPELQKLAKMTKSQDEGLPCEMLQMTDGIAWCKIQILYGKKAKPKLCREYPKSICLYNNPKSFFYRADAGG